MQPHASPLILRTLPVFATLDEPRLAAIAAFAALRAVPRGEVVVREGGATDNVYFVLSGGLKVQLCDADGREVILSVLEPGDMFGELGVIDDHPRSASVVAVQASQLLTFGKQDFMRCLAENFDITLAIMRGMATRLRQADQRIESLALLDVYGRVARLLLEMAETREDGSKIVTRRITKQDMAKMVGASREMVSRVMRDLTLNGLIEERDEGIVLTEVVADALK